MQFHALSLLVTLRINLFAPLARYRVVWPGRIEVIYQAHIHKKDTWLAAYPAKVRTLKANSRKTILENRKSSLILNASLSKRRLDADIEAERLVNKDRYGFFQA